MKDNDGHKMIALNNFNYLTISYAFIYILELVLRIYFWTKTNSVYFVQTDNRQQVMDTIVVYIV